MNRSPFLAINASFIQGSGLGPVSYTINASDLHPRHSSNILFKYADDTYLIVPAINSALILDELDNISRWATANNLKLNTSKSCEMIVSHGTFERRNLPSVHPDLVRVEEITSLGVAFTNTLSCGPHVSTITAKAAASLYAIKTLKRHGMQGQALWDITQATLVPQLTYASPAWRSFIKADETRKLQSVLAKAARRGFLPPGYKTIDELFDSADRTLFSAITSNPEHVLFPLLPPLKDTGYQLRNRSHGFILPPAYSNLLRKNFLIRMLYTDIY